MSLNIFNRDQIFDALIKVYQTDSTEVDSIITLCSNINLLEAKYLKVLCELYQDQTTQAYTSVAEIPSQIDLGALEFEYNDFSWLINKIALYGSIDSIPSSELNISLLHNEQVIAYIRNILIDRDELIYEEPYTFPSSLKSDKIRRTNNIDNKPAEEQSFLRIYPNPTKDFVVVDYNLPTEIDKGSITLFDMAGNVKIFETLHSNSNQIILYLHNLNAGSYILELRDEKSRIESIKLSLIK